MTLIVALPWVVALLLFWALYRLMEAENPLQWWHFIATKGSDGNYYADIDKLGKVTGIAISSWALLRASSHDPFDFMGFAAILGVFLAFAGGTAGYSAFLRSQRGPITPTELDGDKK